MPNDLSDDEKKFVWFWVAVFGSAIGFWVLIAHWVAKIFIS